MPTVALAMIVLVHADSKANVEWVQTALFEDGTMHLLKDMPPLPLSSLEEDVSAEAKALVIDRSRTYQEILGFGGAFTEAAALNWQSLTLADRADVIHLYFGAPEEGGLGYTVGRVPMNSCDFGPGDEQRTYSFANVPNDMHLRHFDDSVAQYDWPESEYSPLLTSHNLLPTSILLPATFDHISGLHAGGVAGWSPVLADSKLLGFPNPNPNPNLNPNPSPSPNADPNPKPNPNPSIRPKTYRPGRLEPKLGSHVLMMS